MITCFKSEKLKTDPEATMPKTLSDLDNLDIGGNPPIPSSESINTYTQTVIIAPPGKLGIILSNRSGGNLGTFVSNVHSDGPLYNILEVGDRIIAVNGEDVSFFPAEKFKEFLSKNADKPKQLTIVSPRRCDV